MGTPIALAATMSAGVISLYSANDCKIFSNLVEGFIPKAGFKINVSTK